MVGYLVCSHVLVLVELYLRFERLCCLRETPGLKKYQT